MTSSVAAQGADRLAEGQRAFLEADLDRSQRLLTHVVETDAVSRDDAVRAMAYLAAIAWARGDQAQSERWARAAVQIEPGVATPAGAPTELASRLDELRETIVPLELTLDARPAAGVAGPTVVARTNVDPPLGATVTVICGDDEAQGEREASLALRANHDRCNGLVELSSGTVLAEESLLVGAVVATSPNVAASTSPAVSSTENRSLKRRRRWIGAITGVLALAGAVVLAVALSSRDHNPQLTLIEIVP